MNDEKAPLLAVSDLGKSYEMPGGTVDVLKALKLWIAKGEMVFVTGKSGSGKSTLLHLLGGLDRPTSGHIFFQGRDLTRMSEKEISRVRARQIGFVFQFYHLLPELTVYENVLLPTLISKKGDKAWIREVLKRVRLWNRRMHFPSELSGGEQQRVAIARALASRPDIVLCDEPTGNLDAETAESVMALIGELHRNEGQSFLIVTHDEDLARRGDRTLRLHEGMLGPAVAQPLTAG